MKTKVILTTALLLLASVVCFLPTTDAESLTGSDSSQIIIDNPGDVTFSSSSGGDIKLKYSWEDGPDTGRNVTVLIKDSGGTSVLSKQTVHFEKTENGQKKTVTIKISSKDGLSNGQNLSISAEGNDFASFQIHVNISQSLLNKWTTYAAIIIVVLLIVILIVVKARAVPKVKNQMTYEQVDAMKRTGDDEEAQQTTAKSTERQKYLSSRKK